MSIHAIHAAPAKRLHVAHACAAAALPVRHPSREAILHAALVGAAHGPERCTVFGRVLENGIRERRPPARQAERVAAAATSLLETPELSVDELARQHRVSRRQLERDFRRWLGIAPAGYARLVRFQRAARAIADGVPLAHVAAEQGYADQAHMTRVFSETAGVTPRQLRDGGGPAAALRIVFAQRGAMLSASGEPKALRLAA